MTRFDFITNNVDSLPNNDSLIVDGSVGATKAARIHNIVYSSDCEIYLEFQTEGGDWKSNLVDSFTGEGISQQNGIEVHADDGVRLRIKNVSGSEGSYAVTGIEVQS